MSRGWVLAVVLGIAGVASGCTALDPFETVPIKPPPGTTDTRSRVGICFDGLASKPPQIEAAAQQACGPGATPRRETTDYGLLNCPILLPGRATFVCVPRK
ncbi:MAG TPA: hypothetical protein VND87_10615 [Stellaceae bacterium]|nr:hypothetical protein [Stellaceae bacterium]